MSTFALTLIHSLIFAVLSYFGYLIMHTSAEAGRQNFFQFFLITIATFPFVAAIVNFLRERTLRNANFLVAIATLLAIVAALYLGYYGIAGATAEGAAGNADQ